MKYKMLFLDLDDTLLSSDLSISKENLDAIRRASKLGVKVVICTGRGIFSVKHIAEQFKIEWDNCYIICLNGGAIYKGFPPVLIKERLFDNKSAALIYETAKKYKVDSQIYRDDKLILENISDRVQMYIDKLNANYMLVESLASYNGDISKILLNGPNDVLCKIEKELLRCLEGFNIFFTTPNYLEFTAIGTTKGEALAELANNMEISLSQTIAMGDSYNDISMIQTAGLGVAVRNAGDKIKAKADYITKNTNNESAVAEVIDRYVIGNGKDKDISYKFRFPTMIFAILLLIEQLLSNAFNIEFLSILKTSYSNESILMRFNVLSICIPFFLCFIVDYFNQMTKKEDEDEFWQSKYGKLRKKK